MQHVLRVKNWPQFFETAKTKGYANRNNCTMPNKHNLGYRMMLADKDGEAMFGAWCAMIQMLSRQVAPRQGYLTDNGQRTGQPYDPSDIALTTGFSERTVKKMLETAKSQKVGWLEVAYIEDTTGIVSIPMVSPQYPSISNLNLNLNSKVDTHVSTSSDAEASAPKPMPPHRRIRFDHDALAFIGIEDRDIYDWKATYPAVNVSGEIAKARMWLTSNPAKSHKKNYHRFITNWLARCQERGGGTRGNQIPADNTGAEF